MAQNIILSAIAIQSLTTAIGLFFIYSTQSRVNEEILKRNFKLAEKNSLYKFNESLTNFLKAFIPLYYLSKGLSIIKDSGDFQKTVDKAIASGKYEPINFEARPKEPEIKITAPEPKVEFELPKEKFKARPNDSSIYDPTENPIEYIERIMEPTEVITPTPYYEVKQEIKPSIHEQKEDLLSDTPTPAQIATYISGLSTEELAALINTIDELKKLKESSFTRTLEKEVA